MDDNQICYCKGIAVGRENKINTSVKDAKFYEKCTAQYAHFFYRQSLENTSTSSKFTYNMVFLLLFYVQFCIKVMKYFPLNCKNVSIMRFLNSTFSLEESSILRGHSPLPVEIRNHMHHLLPKPKLRACSHA